MRPVIKWTGSKREFFKRLPLDIPDHGMFFDPFCGGGSSLSSVNHARMFASDLDADLIGLWIAICHDPESLVKSYREMWSALNSLPKEDKPNYFYQIRAEFNRTRDPGLFNFLTRTSYNGLVRFNKSGEYNAPYHHNRDGIEPDTLAGILNEWRAILQKCSFSCLDYQEALLVAKDGDFAFIDPPYASSNSLYKDSKGFSYDRLWDTLEDMNARSVKWMLTLGGRDNTTCPVGLYKSHISVYGNKSHYSAFKGLDVMPCDLVWTNYTV